MLIDNENFRTKDYLTAATLHACKQRLLKVDWFNGVAWFEFSDKTNCEKILVQYLNSELMVDAKTLLQATKTIKDLLHNQQ